MAETIGYAPPVLLAIEEAAALSAAVEATDADGFVAAVPTSSLAAALRRLADRGLVATQKPSTRRVARFAITPAGRDEYARRQRRR